MSQFFYNSISQLPLVLKGILTAEDAKLGVEAGAAAIWVSNHGARQVDGVPPTVCVGGVGGGDTSSLASIFRIPKYIT